MSEAINPAEKRVHERFTLKLKGSAEVLYRRRLDQAYQDPKLKGSGIFKVESVNVSSGGLMIIFDSEISAGDVLRIFFTHPEDHSEIQLEGQIQWLRRNAMNHMGRYCAGISFRNIPDKAVESLLEHARRENTVPPA
jgi:hypothetical protein